MRRSLARNVLGLLLASALGLATTGCAKDPTELILTLTVDGTPPRPITSLEIKLDAAGVKTSRLFAALAYAPADASVAPFTFPVRIRYLIPNEAIRGVVDVTVEGSDPTVSAAVVAAGMGQGVVQDHKTTTAAVALQVITSPGAGGAGGAGGAEGGGGEDGAGGAGGAAEGGGGESGAGGATEGVGGASGSAP